MSLADIKAKISAEAQSQIQSLELDFDTLITSVTKESDNEIKSIQSFYKDRLAKEEPEIQKRREVVAKLDADKVDLGVKQRLIQEAFDTSLRQLIDLPKDKYLAFVSSLMKKAVQSKEEIVFVGKGEKHIDKAWLESYNTSNQTRLSLSETRQPISGGFILRNGRIDINCSWDMLINDIRSEIESDVVKQLFP